MNFDTFYYKVFMMRKHFKKYFELKDKNAPKEEQQQELKRALAFQDQVDQMIDKHQNNKSEFLGR